MVYNNIVVSAVYSSNIYIVVDSVMYTAVADAV